MARAMTAGELTNIRKDNQWSELYLAVHMPDTVWSGRLNGAPSDNDEVATISVDGGAFGSGYSAAIKDMLMYVGSSAGAYDKGFVRIREDLSGTVTSIDIGEVSEISWADDDYLTIVEEFPLAPRHIRIDGSQVVYMDYDLTYASQSDPHDDPDPVPVLGPSYRPVWLTGASVDVDFDAGDSWTFDGSISGHSFSVFPATGASISGGSTATPTITFTQSGTWRVGCTVTGSNGKSYTAYRYVRVFDTNDMPIQSFVLDECTGNWDAGGWNARITLYDEAGLTDIRKGTMVALFAKDYYGNTEVSQGPIADAETTLMVGWVANESINWDPEAGSVTLEIQGPQYWLSQMNGFPSGLEWAASDATTWLDMTTMTLQKGAWHFIHWRTTLTRILDFQVSTDTRQFALFNASPGTLWGQLTSESFATIVAHPCCDRFGRLFVEVEPQVLTTSERSSVPTVLTVTTEDLRRPVNLERRTVSAVGLVDLSGVVYSGGTGTPLFSLAPGHIFKRLGASVERVDRLALSSQGQSNTLAGHYLGWRNSEYPNVSLPFACNMRMIDVTPHQYVSLSISAGDTIRGISPTLTLVPRTVSFTHDPLTGSLITDVQAESASVEQGSTVGDPPIEPPDPAPPDLPAPDPIPEPDLDPEFPTIVYVATKAAGIYKSTDFTGPSGAMPTWSKIDTGLSSDVIQWFAIDGSETDRDERQYCIAEDASGNLAMYKRESGGSWSEILSRADAESEAGYSPGSDTSSNGIQFACCDPVTGRIIVAYTPNVGSYRRLWVIWSDNQGTSWSASEPGGSGKDFYPNSRPFPVWSYNSDMVLFAQAVGLGASTRGHWMYYGSDPSSLTVVKCDGSTTIYSMQGNQNTFNAAATGYALEFVTISEIIKVTSGGDAIKESGTANAHRMDAWHWLSAAHFRMLRHSTGGGDWPDLLTTTDDFASPASYDTFSGNTLNLIMMCPWVSSDSDDFIIYGADDCDAGLANYTAHHVLVADASVGETTVTAKGGDNVSSAPYTDSIPETGEGVCYNGIQVVG